MTTPSVINNKSDLKGSLFLLVSSTAASQQQRPLDCEWNAAHLCWTLVVLRGPHPMPGRTHESSHRGKASEYTVEEVALFNLTLYADYVWSESSLDVHREACQKTWVKFNRIREACHKTSILDLLAEIRLDHKKTVRDTIPFSHLAQYGNYEYNDVIERGFVNELAAETPLAFDVTCKGEAITWKHNLTLNSLTSESIVQNQLIREANEKADGIDYEQQLEYTESFRKDPSLGRAQEPPLGDFGRICGSFDPIKFNGMVKQLLKADVPSKESNCKDKCVSWTNWLLCVYPEFLQSLCSRDDFAHLMIPDIEMSIDFLEILDKPVSAFDIHQFPKPKLRSWNRCRQGVRRLFQQITSQEVQRLWLCDDYLLDNRIRLGLCTSEEDRHVDSSCHKGARDRMRRSNWIKKSPHLHRREDIRPSRKNIYHLDSDKFKEKDKVGHQVVVGLQSSAATARTPSAPTLTELNFEEFPTLSEAATMNFRQPAAVSGTSRSRQQGERGKKPSPYDCHVEWGIFVGTPLQRNIHSRSDTDLHRSASRGSNSISSPLSDSSVGLRSESDSDLQLQESFRRRESDAHGLLRSINSGTSTSSEESQSPLMQIADDGRMNIHAPSFCPRVATTHSRANLASNAKHYVRPQHQHQQHQHQQQQHQLQQQQLQQQQLQQQQTARYQNWQQQLQRPAMQQADSNYQRRNTLNFQQPTTPHWRQPFPILCKPPPGFETLCVMDSSQGPPQANMMTPAQQQFIQQQQQQQQQQHLATGRGVSFFPQAYSNQFEMFPYHTPLFHDPGLRLASTQSSPRQGPTATSGSNMNGLAGLTTTTAASGMTTEAKDSYLMQQFPYPLGFANQLFPRYVVPPPVRMPTPGQFLPPQANEMWRFPQPPPPMAAPQMTAQSPFMPYGGLFASQFAAMPGLGTCPTSGLSFSEGVQQQFHPLAWFQPQSRGYKTFIPQPQSGYSQENTGRGEERDFRCTPLWRRGDAGGPLDMMGNASSGSDEGRKARCRKRDPNNLVHIVGSDAAQARRSRRTRCRLGRGVLPVHGANGETPSEESEQSATQNDESSEEWPPPESEDFSDVPEAMSLELPPSDVQPLETFMEGQTSLRQHSLNTSESSRSSEPEDIGSPGTTSMDSARLPQSRYMSYKECLQLSAESDAKSDVPPLRLGPSGSFPSSPDKDGRPASVLEDILGGTTSPSSPLSPPPLITPPPRSYVATPTLLCSPSGCEPEALENALLQHLVKWSAAKMASEAEDLRGDKFSFRWIPEEDLERQATEEYCPSKENSHEKIAHGCSPLHRSASGRGRGGAQPHAARVLASDDQLAPRGPPKPCQATATMDVVPRGTSRPAVWRSRSRSVGPMGDDGARRSLVDPARSRSRKKSRKCKIMVTCSDHHHSWGGQGDHVVTPRNRHFVSEEEMTLRTLKKLSMIAERLFECKTATGSPTNGVRSSWSPRISASTNIVRSGKDGANSSKGSTNWGSSPRGANQRVMKAFISSATGFVKRLVFNAL